MTLLALPAIRQPEGSHRTASHRPGSGSDEKARSGDAHDLTDKAGGKASHRLSENVGSKTLHDPKHRDAPVPTSILRSASKGHRDSGGGRLSGGVTQFTPTSAVQVSDIPDDDPAAASVHGSVTPRGDPAAVQPSVGQLRAIYRTDSVDLAIGITTTVFFSQTFLANIPALAIAWFLLDALGVDGEQSRAWLDLVTRILAVFLCTLVLDLPGLVAAYVGMRIASGMPNNATFNPPPEALVAGTGDVLLIVAISLMATVGAIGWAIPHHA